MSLIEVVIGALISIPASLLTYYLIEMYLKDYIRKNKVKM
jgi:peptidoglycan/LPS O-acetylase OafA/YrhL